MHLPVVIIFVAALLAAGAPARAQSLEAAETAPSAETTAPPAPEADAAKLACPDAMRIYSEAAGDSDKALPPAPQATVSGTPDRAAAASRKEDKIAASRKRLADTITKFGEKAPRTAQAYRLLARDYRDAAKYEDSVTALEAAMRIADAAVGKKRAELADIQMELAQTYTNKGDRLSALAMYNAARNTFEEALGSDHPKVALALHNIGKIDLNMTQFEPALAAFATARKVYEANLPAETSRLVELLIDTSSVHARIGNRETALAFAKEAVALAREKLGPDHRSNALALHFAGTINRGMGRSADALTDLGAALRIYLGNEAKTRRRIPEVLDDVSVALVRADCLDQAVEVQTLSIAHYAALYGENHNRVASAYHRLGGLYRESGKFAEARAPLFKAASIYENIFGPNHRRIADVYADLASASARIDLNSEALRYGFRALRIRNVNKQADPEDLRQSYWSLSIVLKQQGDMTAAIAFAKMAVNINQEIRSQNRNLPEELTRALAGRYRELYEYLANMLIGAGRLQEAQQVLDLIKQQELFDFVRRDSKDANLDGRAALTPTEADLSAKIMELVEAPISAAEEIEALKKKQAELGLSKDEEHLVSTLEQSLADQFRRQQTVIDDLLAEVENANRDIEREVNRLDLDLVDATQERLKGMKGRAVELQIASLDDALHIFLTTERTGIHKEVPVGRKEMAFLVFKARSATAGRDPEARQHLQRLYDILVKPVAPELKAARAEVLMFNLSGVLRYVPLAALHSGERYLVEDYAVALSTTAANTRYEALPRERGKAAGFGVTKPHEGFSALPGVAEELETVFDGADTKGYLAGKPLMDEGFNSESMGEALKAKPLYLHVASHFRLVPGDASNSVLLLGDGRRLSLDEFRKDERFRLTDLDLLTLSACETAGGVDQTGAEIESFASVVQKRGASSVLATLWPIADSSTSLLMADFYKNFLALGADKATSLRKAQIAMLKGELKPTTQVTASRSASETIETPIADTLADEPGFQHPYFWSAFILMGNWL
ncbi:CHAT domain-containing protein [Nordella sp. HKS 07]|uniref:CHAT domain-containing protein n=1 Tax=Nordella sp. HKS 07 TaxID=2712222 RepID=UPI0013E150DE|nr:CHAT domain-containing protein [Nordella sp. HKS 07]QIG51737.1 CHAT domain-containing protein [Nordella sp. HKS 07]